MANPKFDDDGYQFPDEVDNKEVDIEFDGEELDVEIVDDTPEEDRNVEPLTPDITHELETADEAAEYSKNVKTKFKQYKKAWHDERRAKEAALREQQEALTMAQKILDDNKRLKTMLHSGEQELITTYQSSAELELEKARRNYKEAYDSGDSDKLLTAQEEMLNASFKVDKAKSFKPTVQIDENDVQIQYPVQKPTQMEPKLAEWLSENSWFADPERTYLKEYAKKVHSKLESQFGQSYVGTDAYYKTISKEVKNKFSDEFGEPDVQNDEDERTQRTQKPSTVVASAKRSTSTKKVLLSKSAQAIAKKLGLTNEQYAAAQSKLES
jgi:hypothetical protein